MNQQNEKPFATPPSPHLEASQTNSVPQVNGEVQNGSAHLETVTNAGTDRPAAGNDLHAERKLHDTPAVVSSQSIQAEENIDERPPEEIAIEEVKKTYKLTPKFNLFRQYYTQKGHSVTINGKERETQYNATVSAIKAYNLDPVKEYDMASVMGSQNLRKLKDIALTIAEEKGYNFEKWLDKGWLQLLKSDNPEWFDRIGSILGYHEPKATTLVQNNTQNNTVVNVGEEQKASFNDQFRSFIKST